MTHPNEEILRMQDKALQAGDLDGFFRPFDKNIIAHVAGKNPMAGTYKGLDQLRSAFMKWQQMSGNLTVDSHDFLANDTHGVVLSTYRATKGGKKLESKSVSIMHLKKGMITEFWTFDEDQYTTDAFYA